MAEYTAERNISGVLQQRNHFSHLFHRPKALWFALNVAHLVVLLQGAVLRAIRGVLGRDRNGSQGASAGDDYLKTSEVTPQIIVGLIGRTGLRAGGFF